MRRLYARVLLLSRGVDRAYRAYDRLRSALVLATASDAVLDEYNAIAYNRTAAYRAGTPDFRTGLFDWEQEAIDRHFPPPPGTVLIGGAGGGREPFALLERGYAVVAFDPAEDLVRAMRAAHQGDALRTGIGSYGDLPILRALDGAPMDLRTERFAAAIVGWASFSHLRTDAERVETLRSFGALTDGPILVSYFPDPQNRESSEAGGQTGVRPVSDPVVGKGVRPVSDPLMGKGVRHRSDPRRWLRRRAGRRGRSVFSVQIGYYRLIREDEMEGFASEAGLAIVGSATDGNFPWVVLRRV